MLLTLSRADARSISADRRNAVRPRPARSAFAAALLACALLLSGALAARADKAWVQLFDGKTLDGWVRVGPGDYFVRDGLLICPDNSGQNLFTKQEYSDFKFKFDFKLSKQANNGVGIRAPLIGDAAYMGMECQILDDYDPRYASLEPGQYCCSLYKIVPAKRGALHHAGQWNHEEITAVGRKVKVVLNGVAVVDTDLNKVTDPHTLYDHPGMLRERGHLGFLGHEPTECEFKNIYVMDLSRPQKDNTPPPGFTALFDGKTMKGWKGLVADPPRRAVMPAAELADATQKATVEALKHWKAVNGEIVYDGKNNNLCTAKDYGDFEMMVDWKIGPHGDSGIYLRGSPQVQIWENPRGSGGLYNNEKNPCDPTVVVDNPIGQWNHYDILMVGDKVTVYFNGVLVTNHVTLENYWERSKPIYPVGQIELQHHGDALWFKNIYIRELPRQ
jgi:hypothetical protein